MRFHRVSLLRYCRVKNEKEIFIAVLIYLLDIYIYIYGEFYTKNYRKVFSHKIECKYMFLNIWTELPTWEANGHIFSWSVLNPSCFETAQAIWVPKHLCPQKWFSFISIQLKLRQLFKISSLKLVLDSYDVLTFIHFYSTIMLCYRNSSVNTVIESINCNT